MSICSFCRKSQSEPRQDRSRRTKDSILDGAGKLFLEHGYDAVNTNAIAREAGLSIGSLYRYFPDKKAVLTALVERETAGFADNLSASVRKDGEKPLLAESISALVDAMAEAISRPQAELCFRMMQAAVASLELEDATRELETGVVGAIHALVKSFRPELDDGSARLAAIVCKVAAEGVLLRISASNDETERDGLARELKRLLCGYLSPA